MFSQARPQSASLAQDNALFNYENIAKHKYLSDERMTFGSNITPKAFISFGYIGDEQAFLPPSEICKIGGWKLHIAIHDRISRNVALAWNIVKDTLIKNRIAESKVIKPGVSFMSDQMQCGKQITIYQFYNPNRDWNQIINEIELGLRESGIALGQFSPTDQRIPKSFYMSYRNDLSRSGSRAINAAEAMKYSAPHNPFEREDPFTFIKIV